MRNTFTIQLKMDMPQGDEETKKIMHDVMRRAAQEIFAAAVMISDKRRPMIAVRSDNNFEGFEEIELEV
jgi:hypothetical protein